MSNRTANDFANSTLCEFRIARTSKIFALLQLPNPHGILDALVHPLVRGPPIPARVDEDALWRLGNQAALASSGIGQADFPPGVVRAPQMADNVAEAIETVIAGLSSISSVGSPCSSVLRLYRQRSHDDVKNGFLLNGTDGIIGITLSSADLQTTRFFARNWGFCLNAVGVFSCLPFPFVIQW